MAVSLTPSGASGTGSQTLTLAMGKNTTRANKTYTFNLAGTGSYSSASGGTLTVTQGYAALAISATTATANVDYSGSSQTAALSGTANGKYLKYEIVTTGLTMSSCTESSGSSATAVGTSYAQVNNFLGGSQVYSFQLNVTIPANTAPGAYKVRVYTSDNSNGTGELYAEYTITVHHTMVISGSDAIASTDNYSDYAIVYTPTKSSDTACTWTLTDPNSVASLTSNGDGTYRLTITDSTASNATVTLSAVNTADNYITASKSVVLTYTSAAVDAPFVVTPNSIIVNSQEVNDYTPEITLRANPAVAITDLSITNRTGFLSSAAISSKSKKIFTTFSENSTASSKSGSLTITYGSGQDAYDSIVSYTQRAKSADLSSTSMEVTAFSFSESSGTISVSVTVKYGNKNITAYEFKGINGKFVGYDESGATTSDKLELFSHWINPSQISNIIVPASDGTTWQYQTVTYTDSWTPTYPSGYSWSDVKRIETIWWNGQTHSSKMGYNLGLDVE